MQKRFDVKSRKKNPQKLTQLSSRSHPRHLVGKRTAQKDITIDTTSDSQVNSNFPNRWSPASLIYNTSVCNLDIALCQLHEIIADSYVTEMERRVYYTSKIGFDFCFI